MLAHLILWGVIFAVMVICELVTFQLVSIWFAAGAIGGFIAALCDLSLANQLLIFVIVSLVLLAVTRPLLKKITFGKAQATNADLDIGKTAVVIEDINNDAGTGRAKINGVDWKAVSYDGIKIPAGTIVTVKEIRGSKLIVSLCEEKNKTAVKI
ncbi:NfeD family protein [Porcipelethomonas sp.]|uniref:NfeD family protein n=1 Tax=Porcipelethomonas sp. TaxID=2981675 RepID=UPI003EF3394A